MSDSVDVAITTVTSILIVAGVAGNSLVCAVVVRHAEMRTVPINYLLFNLAVADMVYSIFTIPVLIVSHTSSHPEGLIGEILCSLLTDGTLAWVGAGASVVTLVTIALERYYIGKVPLGNKGKLTTRKIKVIISATWIFACILQIPQAMNKKFDKKICPNFCIYTWSDMWIPKAYFLLWVGFFGISSAVMTSLYSRVISSLCFSRKEKITCSFHQQGIMRSRKKVTLMVLTVSVIFVICWGVDSAVHLLEDFAAIKVHRVAVPIGHTLIMFNSAINPFAYALISQRFRERMKRIICRSLSSSKPKSIHPFPPHSLKKKARNMDMALSAN
ncbi:galanin receptor 2a-like [Montipora capricornis]|uniref:galanin receptor 2a-like n=1 Tax=Montipora capricornis TaxID=246305 RepID=UPI0035F12418